MVSEDLGLTAILWVIPLLPLAAFLVIVFGLRRLADPRPSGYATIAAVAGSFVLSVVSFFGIQGSRAATGEVLPLQQTLDWFTVGATSLKVGVLLDPLAAVMLVIVTLVSLLVQVYSQGYMAGDEGYSRYYAFMALFTASMLGLVLAGNLLAMYVFWELVGLCSYLLIGFWYQKPEAAAAAKKAFLTTRLGDLGFLVAILILYSQTGSFAIADIASAVKLGAMGGGLLTVTMVLLFAGAVGKSAQFPLHVWLPDAMEGPTPVSALIHAATMVAAGVYLVARAYPLFSQAPDALLVVAGIGGFTALFAATHGIVARDIKRVLAYSTISQLGYMMLGLGVGAYSAGVFHLFNHAFFKALLFLGAGSVIHAVHEQDLLKLGGVGKRLPITAITFLIGGLALAGIFPLSGFWSKDEILVGAWESGSVVLFGLGLVTAYVTAFYISRAWLLTFWGEPRGDWDRGAHAVRGQDSQGQQDSHGHGAHGGGVVRESGLVMTVPLVILASLAVVTGLWGSPLLGNGFGAFLGHEGAGETSWPIMVGSTVVALLGIGTAWAFYGARWLSAEAASRALRPVYSLLINKYWVDDGYNWLVGKVLVGLAWALDWFDDHVVDGAVNGVGWVTRNVLGRVVNWTETGRAPSYGLGIALGVVVIAVVVLGVYR